MASIYFLKCHASILEKTGDLLSWKWAAPEFLVELVSKRHNLLIVLGHVYVSISVQTYILSLFGL